MSEQEHVDLKDLKIQGYKEKVAEQEERIIDLRVEVTVLNAQLREAMQRLDEAGLNDKESQEG